MKQPIGIDQPIAADDKGHGADPKGPLKRMDSLQ